MQLALALCYQGRAAESLEHARRAIEIYDPERHRDVARRFGTDQGVAAHIFAGWGCLLLGYLDEGLGLMDDGVALAETLGQPFHLVFALAFRATAHWERGESDATLEDAQRGRTLADEHGFEWWGSISALWEVAERLVAGATRQRWADCSISRDASPPRATGAAAPRSWHGWPKACAPPGTRAPPPRSSTWR